MKLAIKITFKLLKRHRLNGSKIYMAGEQVRYWSCAWKCFIDFYYYYFFMIMIIIIIIHYFPNFPLFIYYLYICLFIIYLKHIFM